MRAVMPTILQANRNAATGLVRVGEGLRSFLGFGLAFALCVPALACRYNVRDLAFADLEPQPYRLCFYVRNETPAGLTTAVERQAVASFREANVRFKSVNLDADPPAGAQKLAETHALKTFPALVLVSPDQRSLALPFALDGGTERERIASALEAAVASPFRVKLQSRLIEAYAVLLIVEGPDPARNRVVREAAEGAVRQVQDIMARLPKPIKSPPEVATITQEQAQAERVLLWSLGLEEGASAGPSVAVLHGRGKRIGPVLRGNDLRSAALYHVLSVVGQDCECYLDRSWMNGPAMPQRWDAAQQKRVVDQLGFDAESPLVKAEMNAILARGPNPNAKPVGLIGGTDAELLGYQEVRLDPPPAEAAAPSTNDPPPAATVAPTNAVAPSPPDGSGTAGLRWGLTGLAVLTLGGGLALWLVRGRNL